MITSQIQYIEDFDLKPSTTLKVGGCAKHAYFPQNTNEFVELVKYSKNNNLPINIIGAGSNLLVASNGLDGISIFTKNINNIVQLSSNEFEVEAGTKNAIYAKVALENNLADGEFLIGIPGSIGGAVYMNAGAHGQNIKDILSSVKFIDLDTAEVKEVSKEDLEFSYRSSTFSNTDRIILSAVFKQNFGDKNKIKEKMDFHVNYRAQHHPPLTEYSAGSTFRNPTGNYAANLLEQVGAKNYIENNCVRFSTKHANFLYNFNNATSLDVVRLMYKMWQKVYDEFGIKLYPEIKFIGKKSDEEIELWNTMLKI